MANTPSWLCGFEMGSIYEFISTVTATGTQTVQSTTKHSGGFALRCQSGATLSQTRASFQSIAAGGAARAIFRSIRFYLLVTAFGDDGIGLWEPTLAGTDTCRLTMNTDGTLTVRGGSAGTVVTSGNAITTGKWYRIEFDAGHNAGAGARVYVDGTLWATSTDGTSAAADTGILMALDTRNVDLYIDDVVVFSDELAGVTWTDYYVPLLKPTADSNRGNWTGGAGGTTNLFTAIDNQPPVGLTAGADSDTSQIQNATSATYPATAAQLGQFTCQSYTTAGVDVTGTVRAIQAICSHGEGIVTGTKPGGVFVVSNPAQGTLGDWFDYGNDVGALGTFPFTTAGTPTRGWFTAGATPVANPAVTLATAPVIGIFKNVASTRETHVAFAGIYAAYSPGLPTELLGRPDGLHGQAQMHQLLAQ